MQTPTGSIQTVNAVIPNAQTTSQAISLNGMTPVGIEMPGTFTGATLAIHASNTVDGTYKPIYIALGATPLSYAVAASRYIAIDPIQLQGAQFIKLVSGSSEGAERTLILTMKGI